MLHERVWAPPSTCTDMCHLLSSLSWMRPAVQGAAPGSPLPRPTPAVGGPPPHRVAALPLRRGAGAGVLGGRVAVPRWRRAGAAGGVGAKAPSCSSAWSARTPTL
jgi:hypothetical protein